MKKLFNILFLLISMYATFNPTSIFATATTQNNIVNSHSHYFDHSWSGSEENFYYNINLLKDLQFDGHYNTLKSENGRIYEMTFYPLEGHSITSSEGYLLQKIIFVVEVKNCEDPNYVFYSTHSKIFYKAHNHGYSLSITSEFSRSAAAFNPSIDFTQEPMVVTSNDESNQVVISFKNSFPSSNLVVHEYILK